MSQKTAKRLRKIALAMVVSAEQNTKGLQVPKVAYKIDKRGTISVSGSTWKGAYKALKKATSNGVVNGVHKTA